MARKYRQGSFSPRNPAKYKGDFKNIYYRSSWELKCMQKFDLHPDVIQWSSEELVIPYVSPIDGRKHRYFVDFVVKIRKPDGKVETQVIEVKPSKETQPPKKPKRLTESYLKAVMTYGVNQAKWEAAEAYCGRVGAKFVVITEKELNL